MRLRKGHRLHAAGVQTFGAPAGPLLGPALTAYQVSFSAVGINPSSAVESISMRCRAYPMARGRDPGQADRVVDAVTSRRCRVMPWQVCGDPHDYPSPENASVDAWPR
jgi:hypothetical protein